MEQYQQADSGRQKDTIATIAGKLAGSTRMDALGALGYFYLKHRQTDKAMTLFAALGKLFPENPRIILSLAYAHYLAGEYQDSLTLSRQILDRQSPLKRTARILHSRTLIKLGRNNEARQLSRLSETTEEML